MEFNKKLGDKINRGFMLIVIILGTIIAIRFAVAVVRHDVGVNTNQTTTGR